MRDRSRCPHVIHRPLETGRVTNVTEDMVTRARQVIYQKFVAGARWGAGGPEDDLVQGETVINPSEVAHAALTAAFNPPEDR